MERRNCTLGPGGPKTLRHESSSTMVSSPWQRSLAECLQSRHYPLYRLGVGASILGLLESIVMFE